MSAEGLRVLPSLHGPGETLDRLEAAVTRHGMTIFARIDHGAAAKKAGLELRPTVVVFFGNPRAGTPAMQRTPTVAIDLPMRMLIWQDDNGATWLAYNEPAWLFRRHGIVDDGSVDVMIDVLQSIGGEATGR
ncbi:DUF302 domain-containing protein [Reyranella soli]|uniref:DUF302 domain-containing protein n=1 Tax=Reyranella soli TaxID=1230389 RepID=A0A512N5K7_9HYPH|nr:DUF302 domain-containing protein [Reyranella soli]GEP54269.1 hypothetical protein RSO01_14350 [Reyranella soli]